MEKNNNKPKLRFPGFTDPWERRKLSEGMTEYTDRVFIEDDKIYKQVSVKNIGEIVLRGQRKGSKIGRKRQAKVNLTKHPDTLIFTRQTIEQGGIGFAPEETNEAIVTENMPTIDVNCTVFDKKYLLSFIKTSQFRNQVILPNIQGGTAQIAIHEDDILKSEALFPKLKEQQKIGVFLKQLDETITLHQRKLNHLQDKKKSLLQKMFPKKGEDFPELRFPGFTDPWEQRKVKEICSISTGKSNTQDKIENGEYPFYVRSPIIERSNRYLYDEEAVLTVGDGVGTGKVFHYINGKYDLHQRVYRMFDFYNGVYGKYFYYYFSKYFYKRVMSMTAKTSVDSVRYEMISEMDIKYPSEQEQNQIVAVFEHLDNLITLHQRKLNHLKEQKKALLQQMFV